VARADDVFEKIGAEILRGDLPAQTALPPERVLAARFGVSRIIVRQAVHRLADLGLVRASQGGPTMVLDPEEATDLRLLALYYRLAPQDRAGGPSLNDMIERQYLQGLSMVSVAARRGSPEALVRIKRLCDAFAAGDEKSRPVAELEEHFWRAVAKAGGNRIFVMEVAWWYDVLSDRPLAPSVRRLPRKTRVGFYVELARRLVERDHAVEYYQAVMGPVLDALFAR
jgi:GntR family transcriptional repressor for pyruvate dehydrogenase complex